jgi:DNA repair ATPase RecN
MEFSPLITFGNILTIAAIVGSVVTSVITIRLKLDYLSQDLARLFKRLESLDNLVNRHDKDIAILHAREDAIKRSPAILDKITSMMLMFEKRLDDLQKKINE